MVVCICLSLHPALLDLCIHINTTPIVAPMLFAIQSFQSNMPKPVNSCKISMVMDTAEQIRIVFHGFLHLSRYPIGTNSIALKVIAFTAPSPARVPSDWGPKIAITDSINLSAMDNSVIGVVVMVLSAATGTDVNIGRRQSIHEHFREVKIFACSIIVCAHNCLKKCALPNTILTNNCNYGEMEFHSLSIPAMYICDLNRIDKLIPFLISLAKLFKDFIYFIHFHNPISIPLSGSRSSFLA